ncbi:MAG: choice-of-anchor J domain-containing protein [Flavobacteriales bacterium]
MNKHLLAFICAVLVLTATSQVTRIVPMQPHSGMPSWTQLMYTGGHPDEVRAAYESHYAAHPFVKNNDTQYYKRFMRNYMLTGDPSGETSYAEAFRDGGADRDRSSGDWREAGPWHYDPEVAMQFQVQSPGAFHAYCVEQAASNPSTVWTGAATAGAWKSTDKGLNWELMTKTLPITSVYSIAIDPADAYTVLIGEESGSIWKTTDGGVNWYTTGSASFNNQNHWVRDLRFAPGSSNTLFAATSVGLYRSGDAGETWDLLVSGNHMEIEFHPTNPDRIYAIGRQGNGTVFRRSDDGGFSFTTPATGWPMMASGHESQRCEMSVTAASPDRIYVLAAGSINNVGGLYGIYVSNDGGDSFEFQCCGNGPGGPYNASNNPNTLGWSEDGSEDGGQVYYDLALDASPTDPDRLFSGGIIVWRSENAGEDWSMNAHWVTWVGEFTAERYVHADVHDIKFFQTENGVDLWFACDGGIYYSADEGDTVEPRMYGIHGTDFWGWQAGWRNGETMVGGTYHNGTMIKNGSIYAWGGDDPEAGGWLGELGGDNFRGFVNPGDGRIGYHDGGSFQFSDDRFTRITGAPFDNSKRPNTGYWYGEYGNLEWDPRCYNRFYSPVGSELWRTDNGGKAWTLVYDFEGQAIISLKVAPRDPNRIYVSHRQTGSNWRIWRTADGGSTWENVSIPATLAPNGDPIYLEVDGENPDRLWAIRVNAGSGNRVFESTNGGDTWTNLTTPALNGDAPISIAHQRGSNGGIYLGTPRRVLYRDDSMSDWEAFDNGLPTIAPAVFMQPNYCNGRLRIAGSRGVYESEFHTPSTVQAAFMADRLVINAALECNPEPVRFSATPVALCDNADYEWSFPGGDVVDVTGPEALVAYSTPGTYSVSLTVTDADGNSGSFTWESMISVTNEPMSYPVQEDFNAGFVPENWKVNSSGNGGSWEQASEIGNAENIVAQFPNYWVDTQGEDDWLILPGVDLSAQPAAELTFDVAHQQFNEYVDGLEVRVRAAGSTEWTTVYSKFGADLAVNGCYMWFWYDSGGEVVWRNENVDLSAFLGESCVEIAFVNVGGYGNHIWVDNVNVFNPSVSGIAEVGNGALHVYPNPTTDDFNVRVSAEWLGSEYVLYDATGRQVEAGRIASGLRINGQRLTAGVYVFVVPGLGQTRVVKR